MKIGLRTEDVYIKTIEIYAEFVMQMLKYKWILKTLTVIKNQKYLYIF